MASIFDFVKAPSLKKFEYDLSHEIKFSGKVGDLIPFNWQFLSPGDSVKLNASQFLRTAPLVHPIYQRMNVDVHHFFVPLRLIWDDFEKFITGFDQKTGSPDDTTNHPKFIVRGANVTPQNLYMLRQSAFKTSSLMDYLGFPVHLFLQHLGIDEENSTAQQVNVYDQSRYDNSNLEMSILPMRAYTKIFNDYYRDSIKEPEVGFSTDSVDVIFGDNSEDVGSVLELRQRAYSRDYFTTSQPTPQLGEDVTLPSPIVDYGQRVTNTPNALSGNYTSQQGFLWNNQARAGLRATDNTFTLSDGAKFTINKLRELFSVQRWRDTGNKFGSRYKEQVIGHFGVETPDARLQRPQFLGGGRIPLMINQVSQLSQGNEDSPLGYQAGQGMASGADNFVEFEALEHGIIMSIISVLPENTYYNGLQKKWRLFDRFDFPFPEFATLGEQEVNSGEINLMFDGQTYGYQERYAEFKSIPSVAMGEFRTNLRDFFMASEQRQNSCLDTENIRAYPDILDNVFAVDVSNADNVYFLINLDFTKYSPLPYLNRVTTDYV